MRADAVLVTFPISSLQATSKGFVLIQTKEVSMRPEDVKRVFQNSAEDLVEWITKGQASSLLHVLLVWLCCSKSFSYVGNIKSEVAVASSKTRSPC